MTVKQFWNAWKQTEWGPIDMARITRAWRIPHLLRVLDVYEVVEVDHAVAAWPALCQGRGCEQRPALDAWQTAVRQACPGGSARCSCLAARLTSERPQSCS